MTAKDPLKFDDTDFTLTKLIAAGVTGLTAVISIVNPVIAWVSGDPFVTQLDGVDVAPAGGGKPGVTLTHSPELTAEIADAGPGLWLASLAPSVLFVALLGLVVWLLWQLLDDVQAGRPFAAINVKRMRGIAMVIIVGAALMFVVQGIVNGVMSQAALEGSTMFFSYDTSLSDLLLPGVGFLLAALAEAFRRGIELESEVEGLV